MYLASKHVLCKIYPEIQYVEQVEGSWEGRGAVESRPYFIVGMATAAWVWVTSVSRHSWVTVLVWV